MPLMRCQVGSKLGWKFGPSGKCFPGPDGKSKAIKQGRAIKASQSREDAVDDAVIRIRRRQAQFVKPKKKPPKRLPVWLYPFPIERQYSEALVGFVNSMTAKAATMIIPHLQSLIDERNLFVPEAARADDYAESLARLIQGMSLSFSTVPFNKATTASMAGNATNAWNEREWRKQLTAAFGVNVFQREPFVNSTLNAFTKDNVALITRMQSDYLSEIEGVVSRGIRQGKSARAIAGEMIANKDLFDELKIGAPNVRAVLPSVIDPNKPKDLYRKTRNRAKLIADDQIGKLNGDLTQLRQTNLGITSYKWRTSQDRRVRPEHMRREGEIFQWDKPPADGHPGEAVRCRCYAEPIFDDVFEEIAR